MAAYYNEFMPEVADWLRGLIAAGQIPAGDVDTRSIEDVRPDDLAGYDQCHFFAGIGGWPLALRLAGWPDDMPVWTGSPPCQPFSQAGRGAGFDDKRHLWPAFSRLIGERRPSTVFGEQVASKAVDDWIDLVQDDVEAMGYAFGATPHPSASVGAPHIRDRTFWVADANWQGPQGWLQHGGECTAERPAGPGVVVGGLANASDEQRHGLPVIRRIVVDGQDAGWPKSCGELEPCGDDGGLADSHRCNEGRERLTATRGDGAVGDGTAGRPGPTNSFWADADWLHCRDGKWRPVEPGSFPLAYGLPRGLGKLPAWAQGLAEVAGLDAASLRGAKAFRRHALSGFGNAINPFQGAEFVSAYMEMRGIAPAYARAAA